jgi:hypothetical protein
VIDPRAVAEAVRARVAAYVGHPHQDPHNAPVAASDAPTAPKPPQPTPAPRSTITKPSAAFSAFNPCLDYRHTPDSEQPVLGQLADLTKGSTPWDAALKLFGGPA